MHISLRLSGSPDRFHALYSDGDDCLNRGHTHFDTHTHIQTRTHVRLLFIRMTRICVHGEGPHRMPIPCAGWRGADCVRNDDEYCFGIFRISIVRIICQFARKRCCAARDDGRPFSQGLKTGELTIERAHADTQNADKQECDRQRSHAQIRMEFFNIFVNRVISCCIIQSIKCHAC